MNTQWLRTLYFAFRILKIHNQTEDQKTAFEKESRSLTHREMKPSLGERMDSLGQKSKVR